ncbi:MAG: short-chain dehydrogenase/reductase [Rhodospirillales bacterium]|jgi:NAD(P)-dependent dehydrogenase (short-subunit alcohol dehydrogenase family)|nr:short-chain dehydrogenase/reductase [Rhodospirillales bacterium]
MAGERNVFILGGSADIGRSLAERYLAAGCRVTVTYRRREAVADLARYPLLHSIACDVSDSASIAAAAAQFEAQGRPWDDFLSCVGTMEPIGPFFGTSPDAWQRSIHVNALGQLHALHALYPHRRPGRMAGAMFLAGGGTNNPFRNYSAYAASKIMLIKMAELLDDECPDLNVFVLGPGFVRTKIHDETLRSGEKAGGNLAKTRAFLTTQGTSHDDIFQCVEWCFVQGRDVVGGRNLSVVHDPWRNGGAALATALRNDRDLYKLRRRQDLSGDAVATRSNS